MSTIREGLDYGSGPIPPQIIKQAKRDFVCRYVHPGKWTQMYANEYKQLLAANIDVVFVWESTKTRSLEGGYTGGQHDMNEAIDYVQSIGGPDNAVIYIAAQDIVFTEPGQLAAMNAYTSGAANIRGHDLTGAYGGYAAINYLVSRNVCKYYWQTYAWSDGIWHPASNIQQYSNDVPLLGYSVDFDRAMTDDFGQTCGSPFDELFGPAGC